MSEKATVGNISLQELMEAIGGMMDRKLAKVEDLGEKIKKIRKEILKAEIHTIKAEQGEGIIRGVR